MPPAYPQAAVNYAASQEALAYRTKLAVRRLWDAVRVAGIDGSWQTQGPRILAVVSAAQLVAAEAADPYLDAVLAELGIPADRVGTFVPEGVAGIASDGRDLQSLLTEPVIGVKLALKQNDYQGVQPDIASPVTPSRQENESRAMASQGSRLEMLAQTMVQDAGRLAVGAALAARSHVTGHVRMLTPPSCSRCAILAGRLYRWSSGFRRHPRCDCVMIPADEDVAGDLRTDPKLYFESLSKAEQDRVFTKAGAESVRLGADMGQVVNARRGAYGLTPAGARITNAEAKILRNGLDRGHLQSVKLFGRDVHLTTEGTTRRGFAGKRLGAWSKESVKGGRYQRAKTARLMPETILEIAEDRADAVRLLKRYGFLI